MPLSAETTARLTELRHKVLAGTSTREEEIEGIRILRQDRVSAQTASTKSRTTKAEKAAPVDAASVLSDLKKLGAKLSSGPVA